MARAQATHLKIMGLQDDTEIGTILHEVIHLIANMNELNTIKDDETTIAVLANCLNVFLSDNAYTIIKYYTGEKEETVA